MVSTVDRETVVRSKSYVAELVSTSGAVGTDQTVAHEDSDRVAWTSGDDRGRVMMTHPFRNRDVHGCTDIEAVGVTSMTVLVGDRSVDQITDSGTSTRQ